MHWEKNIFVCHLTLREHLTLPHWRCLPPHHGNRQKPDCAGHGGSAARTTGSALAPAARLQRIPGSYCTLWNGLKNAACLLLSKSWGQTVGHTEGWTFEDKVSVFDACATGLDRPLVVADLTSPSTTMPSVIDSSTLNTACNISWKGWLTNYSGLKNRHQKKYICYNGDRELTMIKTKGLFLLLHVNI